MHFLACLLLAFSATEKTAAAPANQVTSVVVCLRITEHPILTPIFRTSLQREVQDQMIQLFGPGVPVKVVHSGHWLIDDYPGQSIATPDFSPELWRSHEQPEKIFLFGIDYRDNQYCLTWRQIDTSMRFVHSDRHRETPDRQWVARALCLAVKEDFGVLADLHPSASPESVALKFRGEEQAKNLKNFLGEQCVFQPYEIVKRRSGQIEYQSLTNTILLWNAKVGMHKASVYSNASDPWKTRAGSLGFVAIRIPTQQGRLRLQLVDEKTGSPLTNCTVFVNDKSFSAFTDQDIVGSDRFGTVASTREFHHIAFIKISQGTWDSKLLPLAISSPIVTKVLRLSADQNALARTDYERNLRFLIQDVATLRSQQDEITRDANQLNDQRKYEEAVAHLDGMLKSISPRLQVVRQSLQSLQQTGLELKVEKNPLLDFVTRELAVVGERDRELEQSRAAFSQSLRTQEAHDRAKKHVELARQSERNGDFEDAIERYELALGEQPNQPNVQKRLEELQQQWEIKSDEHKNAREFVTTKWPSTEIANLKTLLPDAEKALRVLNQVGDPLTAQKLLRVNSDHINALSGLIDELNARGGEADRAEIAQYTSLIQSLANLQDQIGKFIDDSLTAASAAAPASAAPPEKTDSNPKPPSKSLLDEEEIPAEKPQPSGPDPATAKRPEELE